MMGFPSLANVPTPKNNVGIAAMTASMTKKAFSFFAGSAISSAGALPAVGLPDSIGDGSPLHAVPSQ